MFRFCARFFPHLRVPHQGAGPGVGRGRCWRWVHVVFELGVHPPVGCNPDQFVGGDSFVGPMGFYEAIFSCPFIVDKDGG